MNEKLTFNVALTGDSFHATSEYNDDLIVVSGDLAEMKDRIMSVVDFHFEGSDKIFHWEDIELKFELDEYFTFFAPVTISGVAEMAGLNRSLLAQYVAGQKKPSEKQLAKIEKALHNLGGLLSQIRLTT